jgi:hypothetical protein
MARQLFPLRQGPQHGIPQTVAGLEWISFHREFNGAEKAGALVKCGGRVYVDPPKFLEWMAGGPRISPPVARKPRASAIAGKGRPRSKNAA